MMHLFCLASTIYVGLHVEFQSLGWLNCFTIMCIKIVTKLVTIIMVILCFQLTLNCLVTKFSSSCAIFRKNCKKINFHIEINISDRKILLMLMVHSTMKSDTMFG